jgi:translation initiation factor IF-2
MASTNVTSFAAELKVPADVLLEQLRSAGVDKASASDTLTESDKAQLLTALRRAHGADDVTKKKITVVRKQTSEIKQADATGRARTIQVEVRKKRVFVQREAEVAEAQPSAEALSAAAQAAAQAQQEAAEREQREQL